MVEQTKETPGSTLKTPPCKPTGSIKDTNRYEKYETPDNLSDNLTNGVNP